jgi:hypothetical protein
MLFNLSVYAETYELDQKTIEQYVSIIKDEKNWEQDITVGRIGVEKSDPLFQCVELLGAIRCSDERICTALVSQMGREPTMLRSRFGQYFVDMAIIRIDAPTVNLIMEKLGKKPIQEVTILPVMMPYDSSLALIQPYREQNKYDSKIVENMNKLEAIIISDQNWDSQKAKFPKLKDLPKLHDFTLNHPLYKARQSVIKSNLELAQRILLSNPNLSAIDADTKSKLLASVEELSKVRAVEAVDVIVPILLLQADNEITGLDKKYFSLQKYPIGIALSKIGIPSIWGLLDEIAKRSDNSDEYRKIARDVMTTILIEKAIPGFVNETLVKYKDNELAQIRLAKLLPLLGEDAEKITFLKPQFRNWKSTDGLFETHAKFISLDKKNDVTLEKENGKKTTIEFSALQKIDQNYVKEFIKQK